MGINQKCLADHDHYENTAAVLGAILLFRHVVELWVHTKQNKRKIICKFKTKCCGTVYNVNILIIIYFLVCAIFGGGSLLFINSGTELMNCQKYLNISVTTDNMVSIFMIIYFIYESTQSRDYVFLERAALNIVTAEQENTQSLMEGSFRQPKNKEFVEWDKSDCKMEEKFELKNQLVDRDNDGSYELIDVLIPR